MATTDSVTRQTEKVHEEIGEDPWLWTSPTHIFVSHIPYTSTSIASFCLIPHTLATAQVSQVFLLPPHNCTRSLGESPLLPVYPLSKDMTLEVVLSHVTPLEKV